jgi:hypothetical protein
MSFVLTDSRFDGIALMSGAAILVSAEETSVTTSPAVHILIREGST